MKSLAVDEKLLPVDKMSLAFDKKLLAVFSISYEVVSNC